MQVGGFPRYFYSSINFRNLVYSYTLSTQLPSLLGRLKCLIVVVNAQECQHRDEQCLHCNNELAPAQECCDVGS